MRISDWSADVCSSDLRQLCAHPDQYLPAASAPCGTIRPRNPQCLGCPGHTASTRSRVQAAGSVSIWFARPQAVCAIAPPPHQSRRIRPSTPSASAAKGRSEEHTSELQSLMRISYAVFCLKKKIIKKLYNIIDLE